MQLKAMLGRVSFAGLLMLSSLVQPVSIRANDKEPKPVGEQQGAEEQKTQDNITVDGSSQDEPPKEQPTKEEQTQDEKQPRPVQVEPAKQKVLTAEEQILTDHPKGRQFRRMLQLHNSSRARYNLRPFRLNGRLVQAADRFAGIVNRTRSFGHYADGRSPADRMAAEGYQYTSWAENLAWSGSDPNIAMNTWMNSGGHRANILSGHDEVGFGVSGDVWVAVFGNSGQSQSGAENTIIVQARPNVGSRPTTAGAAKAPAANTNSK